MLILWQIPVITKQCFQNIQRTFHKFLFQKYSKDIPGILQGYENIFMKSKYWKNCFVGYSAKILILGVSELYWNRVWIRVMFWKGSHRWKI